LSSRLKFYFKEWINVFEESFEETSMKIKSLNIDILIDLSGHTKNNKLPVFFMRSAPIQISWLGYWATTGLSEIDYIISDPYLTPEKYKKYFSEKVLNLPSTRWCFSQPEFDVGIKHPKPENRNQYVYGCFSNFSKINSNQIYLWSKILQKTKNSKLVLMTKQFKEEQLTNIVYDNFMKFGIMKERIVLLGPISRKDYLDMYNEVDLILDTFPFSGGTTTMEGLWMGVPTLTLYGETMVSRQGLSILKNLSMNEYIASSESEYISKAINLYKTGKTTVKKRIELRKKLCKSNLLNAEKFSDDFDNILRKVVNSN